MRRRYFWYITVMSIVTVAFSIELAVATTVFGLAEIGLGIVIALAAWFGVVALMALEIRRLEATVERLAAEAAQTSVGRHRRDAELDQLLVELEPTR